MRDLHQHVFIKLTRVRDINNQHWWQQILTQHPQPSLTGPQNRSQEGEKHREPRLANHHNGTPVRAGPGSSGNSRRPVLGSGLLLSLTLELLPLKAKAATRCCMGTGPYTWP